MAYADEQSYEEMISLIQTFLVNAEDECAVMESAGEDCVDNTEDDEVAKKANTKLVSCIADIRASFEQIRDIAVALQEELEDIRERAAKANFDD